MTGLTDSPSSLVLRPEPGRVEAWSQRRLPFEPTGDMRDFRSALRLAVSSLVARDEEQLHATYSSKMDGAVDVENVLIYNVGPAAFARSSHSGLLIERRFALHDAGTAAGSHHYAYEVSARPRGSWKESRPMAALGPATIPVPGHAIAPLWLALRRGPATALPSGTPGDHLGLEIEIAAPSLRAINLAALVKVLVDAVMSTFSRFEIALTDPTLRLLADRLGVPGAALAELLRSNPAAVLGDRVLLHRRGLGYQWNPDDGKLVHIALRRVRHLEPPTGWTLSARLLAMAVPDVRDAE